MDCAACQNSSSIYCRCSFGMKMIRVMALDNCPLFRTEWNTSLALCQEPFYVIKPPGKLRHL